MSLEQEVKLLRNVGLFANVDACRLKLLAFASEWLTFQPGDVLGRQNEQADAAYLIVEGEVEVSVEGPCGPLVVATRGANEIVGEISILIDVPRIATITAKTPVCALRISKDVFRQLLKDCPQTALEIIRTLASRLEDATRRLQDYAQCS